MRLIIPQILTALPRPVIHTNSYDAGSPGGTLNPITAPDLTLMNVLGYNLASPSETLPLPSQAIEITVASLLEDLVVNQINSSDGAAPAGD